MDTETQNNRGSLRKMLFTVILIALIALVFTIDVRRREAEAQLKSLTVKLEQLQTGNTEQNREAAEKIVKQLRVLIDIPEDVEPTVATIIDVEVLRKENSFYNKAKNGDYIIITPERAILFDAVRNKILDVVPVQLQPAAGADVQGQVIQEDQQ